MKTFHNENVMYITDITLRVKDLEKSIDFYEKIIGLNTLKKENKAVHLGIETPLIKLVEDDNIKPKARETGLYHFAILLPKRRDLADFLARLIEYQYQITGGSDHGVSQAIYLNDPDGNGIEVYYDRDSKAWPKDEENRISMFTEALDYQDLLSEKSEQLEPKMPKGTIMGHLHFHVRNIDEARHFFTEVIGFDLIQQYGPSALFTSNQGYHHHVGMNVWLGSHVANNVGGPGLISYRLYAPQAYFANIKKRLIDAGIEVKTDGTNLNFYDINGVLVHLTDQF